MEINPERNVQIWCVNQITDAKTMFVQLAGLLALSIQGCFMLCYLFKIRKVKEIKLTSVRFYIAFWWITIVTKTIISLVIYFNFMKQQNLQNKKQIIKEEMILIGISLIGDKLSGFFMITAMMTIPCHWLFKILNNIQIQQNKTIICGNDSLDFQDIQLKQRKFIHKCFSILKCLSIYRKIRMIQILLCISCGILLIFWNQQQGLKYYLLIHKLFPITETILITLIYGFGFYTLRRLKLLLTHLKQSELKKIKLQYSILVICSLIRLGYNSLFFIKLPYQYNPNDYCLDQSDQWSIKHSIVSAIAFFFMHIIPAAIIIRIYWFNNNHNQNQKQLLLENQSS